MSLLKFPGSASDSASAAQPKARPATPPPSEPEPSPADEEEDKESTWACPVCTLINSMFDLQCTVCETPRPEMRPPPSPRASLRGTPLFYFLVDQSRVYSFSWRRRGNVRAGESSRRSAGPSAGPPGPSSFCIYSSICHCSYSGPRTYPFPVRSIHLLLRSARERSRRSAGC